MSQICLMDYQKDAIINMLVTCVEQNTSSFEISDKPSKKKHKAIVTGNRLGKSLSTRKVKWKVLICDTYCNNLIAPLLKVGDLRAFGVTLTLNIKETRLPITDAPALYFVEPTKENIDIICKVCFHVIDIVDIFIRIVNKICMIVFI